MHGWRRTRYGFLQAIEDVVNKPHVEVEFLTYDTEGEQLAQAFSFQPSVFYLLLAGGVASFFVFLFLP
jgi:hypothetical protein